VNGVKYWWCKHCRCRKTGKIGLYHRSHSTSHHRGPRSGSSPATNTSPPGGANTQNSDSTSSSTRSSTGGSAANLSAKGEAESAPNGSSSPTADLNPPVSDADAASVDSDPDGFTFQGAFMHSTNADIWLASVAADDEDDGVDPLPAVDFLASALDSISIVSPASAEEEEVSTPV
jgi:hypothetical protein